MGLISHGRTLVDLEEKVTQKIELKDFKANVVTHWLAKNGNP